MTTDEETFSDGSGEYTKKQLYEAVALLKDRPLTSIYREMLQREITAKQSERQRILKLWEKLLDETNINFVINNSKLREFERALQEGK